MNRRNFFLFLISILTVGTALCQEIDKLNKSELRGKVLSLNAIIESQNQQISLIEKERNDLMAQKKELENNIDLNNAEIEKLKSFAKTVLSEQSESKSNYEKQISTLNKSIAELEKRNRERIAEQDSIVKELNAIIIEKDSLSKVQEQNIGSLTMGNEQLSMPTQDFLNDYYLKTPAIQQGLFELKLSKVIYEKIDNSFDRYDYNNDPDFMKNQLGIFRGELAVSAPYDRISDEYRDAEANNYEIHHSIPELLNADDLLFFGAKANVQLKRETKLQDYLELKNVSYFNDALPKIEILKNKLFTLKYPNGQEESFLLNVRSSDLGNNNRKIVQLELANESVKQEGVDNFSKDVVWKIYSIGNEAYIGLSLFQLRRINMNIFNPEAGIEIKENGFVPSSRYDRWFGFHNRSDRRFEQNAYRTSGNGIYFSRKKDKYIVNDQLISPIELVYLFKVKKIE
jgi:hypothetical protein